MHSILSMKQRSWNSMEMTRDWVGMGRHFQSSRLQTYSVDGKWGVVRWHDYSSVWQMEEDFGVTHIHHVLTIHPHRRLCVRTARVIDKRTSQGIEFFRWKVESPPISWVWMVAGLKLLSQVLPTIDLVWWQDEPSRQKSPLPQWLSSCGGRTKIIVKSSPSDWIHVVVKQIFCLKSSRW